MSLYERIKKVDAWLLLELFNLSVINIIDSLSSDRHYTIQ